MKNILSFLYDSILIICFLFVIVAAFVATYALSPIPYGKSHLAKNESSVLGEKNNPIEFEDAYKESNDFKVSSFEGKDNYKAVIDIGPLEKGKIKKKIVITNNPSSVPKSINLELKTALNQDKGVDIGLLINGRLIVHSNDSGSYKIGSNEKIEIFLEIDSSRKVNYPMEVEIKLEAEI